MYFNLYLILYSYSMTLCMYIPNIHVFQSIFFPLILYSILMTLCMYIPNIHVFINGDYDYSEPAG